MLSYGQSQLRGSRFISFGQETSRRVCCGDEGVFWANRIAQNSTPVRIHHDPLSWDWPYESIVFSDHHIQVVHAELQAGRVDFLADRLQSGIAVWEVGAVDRVGTVRCVPDPVVDYDVAESAGFRIVDDRIGRRLGDVHKQIGLLLFRRLPGPNAT